MIDFIYVKIDFIGFNLKLLVWKGKFFILISVGSIVDKEYLFLFCCDFVDVGVMFYVMFGIKDFFDKNIFVFLVVYKILFDD